jgi:hypothetical protein
MSTPQVHRQGCGVHNTPPYDQEVQLSTKKVYFLVLERIFCHSEHTGTFSDIHSLQNSCLRPCHMYASFVLNDITCQLLINLSFLPFRESMALALTADMVLVWRGSSHGCLTDNTSERSACTQDLWNDASLRFTAKLFIRKFNSSHWF